jgi:hypothetical protein
MATKKTSTYAEFEVVSHDEVPEGRNGRGQLGPASQALLAGETIWMPGTKNRAARFSRLAKPRGFRVRTRAGERNGERGTFIWLEALEPVEA